ncbi:MAG: glycosyltransferase family 2 protein [Clostridiales bacterium]|nr:glycosyltransferase family 2 protein [Clostridiales bacterium]
MESPAIFIVVPCYNEEAALPQTGGRLIALLARLIEGGAAGANSRIALVDDGSRDATWQVIERLAGESSLVEGIKLSRNCGHQNALWAGLMAVRGRADAAISIDADLQDDPEAIPRFLEKFREGCDVVYGVRSKRERDTAFKRLTAQGFYTFMRRMGVDVVYNHADYRLLSRRALDALSQYTEVNLFLRGMVPLLGFRTAEVPYERHERVAGESKYPLSKMLAFAMQGITSFSVKPIRWIALLGACFALLGLLIALYALISLAAGVAVAGWTSIMVSIWIIGGVQLIALGLIGEYVGRVYTEVKRRPLYQIERTITHYKGENTDGGHEGE